MTKTLLLACSLLVPLAVPGCGTEDPPGPDGGPATDAAAGERYFPLATGRTWTYLVTDPATGTTREKTSTVEVFEDAGGAKAGIMAFRVRTEKSDGLTVSWQEDTGTSVVRHREQALDLAGTVLAEETYEPFKLRLDEAPAHLVPGASWSSTYTETKIEGGITTTSARTEAWSVEAVGEVVTVPAGTFSALRVRRVNPASGSDKIYWFARGVGKVKETGGQTEELTTYGP